MLVTKRTPIRQQQQSCFGGFLLSVRSNTSLIFILKLLSSDALKKQMMPDHIIMQCLVVLYGFLYTTILSSVEFYNLYTFVFTELK